MVVDEPVGCNSTGSLCEIHTQGIGHPSNESKVIAHHHDAGINQSVTAMTQMTTTIATIRMINQGGKPSFFFATLLGLCGWGVLSPGILGKGCAC